MAGSDSSESVNVELNLERIIHLGYKIVELLYRKNKHRRRNVDFLNEYWALRFALLYYESHLCPKFDNEDEVVAHLKQIVFNLRSGLDAVG